MKKIFTLISAIFFFYAAKSQTYHVLSGGALSQNWNNTGLITANDDWSGVPSIIGYRGDDITAATGALPDTLLGVGTPTVDVIANQTNPNTLTSGGVAEFEITDPTIALQGSGTADAPNIVLFLNTTNRQNINVSFLLRDIDGGADDAIQPVAVQYRIGNTGPYTTIFLVADATSGPNLATMTTPVSVNLPAAADDQPMVEVRIITANAAGSDEWVGIDDIVVSQGSALPLNLLSFTASLSNNKVEVMWTTANEVNVAGYDVERSVNGKDFMPISLIAADNAGTTKQYSYTDPKAVAGVSYYRLKMKDLDGSFRYSQVVPVKTSSIGVSVYPNPVRTAVTIQHESAENGAVISIFGMNGKQLINVNVQAGAVQTTIDAGKLAPGAYMIIYSNNGQKQTKQFIKE